jgi:acylpyruvate hydrolase
MRLVTAKRAGRPRAGILIDGAMLDFVAAGPACELARLVPHSVRAILEAGESAIELIKRIIDQAHSRNEHLREIDALICLDETELLAPIPEPSLILSCGMNYGEHLREMNTPAPEKPTGFCKSVSAIVGPDAPILLPKSHPNMVDWEGEFSAVIGRHCYNVSARDAFDYVAGYTIINDISARDWVAPVFAAKGILGPVLAWEQNLLGKQFPTFCPMGPVLVTKDEIPAPDALNLTTRVNEKIMQSANTGDLVFGVARLIEYYSQFYQFKPGDVITTGSPGGVGYGRKPPIFLRPSDVVTVEVDGVGILSNPVRNIQ